MNESLSGVEYSLSAAASMTLIAVAVVLSRHDHRQQFPAFTAYIRVSAINSVAQLLLSRLLPPMGYFCFYWSMEVLVYALIFCVVKEVFESLTDQVKWLTPRGKGTLIRIAILLAVIAAGAALAPPKSRYPVMELITSLQRGLGLAIFAFMGTFVIFARAYSIEWRRKDSGIALGMFLAYSFRSLWPTVNAYLLGYPEQRFYRLITPILELVGALVWLYVFARNTDRQPREERKRLAVVGR